MICKTPFEEFNGKMPDGSHLRVFGCAAYAHIPKDERKKFDVKGALVGYGTEVKGYHFFNPVCHKVFYS